MIDSPPFLDDQLNVNWLRPESALWDAIASEAVSQHEVTSPSLDLGSGNGLFSFITAGGAFSPEYDWYLNANPAGFWENRDIYDTYTISPQPRWIIRRPTYQMDWALDLKGTLLCQAQALGFYRQVVTADANQRLPFEDESFQTLFSNILYWLDSPERSLCEIWRILRPRGRALLCLQDHKFKDYCMSYRWKELGSEILRLCNRGRSESARWTISYAELKALARTMDFKMVSHSYYLSPLTLRAWDIGLRPLSAVLINMVQKLNPSDAALTNIITTIKSGRDPFEGETGNP